MLFGCFWVPAFNLTRTLVGPPAHRNHALTTRRITPPPSPNFFIPFFQPLTAHLLPNFSLSHSQWPRMATPAQVAANQANSQKSTGPKSPDGKTRSSRNSFKHGLYSKDLVL